MNSIRLTSLVAAVAAAVLAAACTAAPTVTPSPSPISTPSPSPISTPSASPRPSPIATASPSPIPTPGPSPTPTERPTRQPTPTPTPTPDRSPVVVTFRVVDEEYRILLIDPVDIAIARLLLDGEEAPTIPNGLIVRGDTSVNEGWSWSIDPESLEFADVTMEVCDGLPSHVEDGTLAGDRYCPWSAEVIAIEPALLGRRG